MIVLIECKSYPQVLKLWSWTTIPSHPKQLGATIRDGTLGTRPRVWSQISATQYFTLMLWHKYHVYVSWLFSGKWKWSYPPLVEACKEHGSLRSRIFTYIKIYLYLISLFLNFKNKQLYNFKSKVQLPVFKEIRPSKPKIFN